MIRTITVREVLNMTSFEDNPNDDWTVQGSLTTKRTSPHYQDLVDSIRRNGFTIPILIETHPEGPVLADGHHRVTAAHELGLDTVPWTSDPTLAARIETMQWTLTPGVINATAIEAFTRDGSGGLAIAIHDATGWPLIEVGSCDGMPMHFMVRRPDGLLLDINGTHTDAAVADEFWFYADDDVTLTEAPRGAVWFSYYDECGEPVPLDLARTFVDAVLDRAGAAR
ncbi:ParB/RepB/Spo0J family partition protein [Streptomyces sp. NPDC002994]|uniref:ParB/RepB/Spo0J family partition protein n=1 Tax=Streptomyces sp. NPDC002994 TaxID=3154441 RepID=UPI00339E8044